MATMIDTNGKEPQIAAPGQVATLQSIGWKVKADAAPVLPSVTPATEQEWDTIFGMRR